MHSETEGRSHGCDDEKIVQRFRLSKRTVTYVVNLIETSPMWPPPSRAVRLRYYDTSACNSTRTAGDTIHRQAHNRCTVYDTISERSNSVGNSSGVQYPACSASVVLRDLTSYPSCLCV